MRKSILIADDEHDILLALDLILKDAGYDVRRASNGDDTLERLGERVADLVITDHMMPRLTGLETIQAMKSDPRFRSIPVILMSVVRPILSPGEAKWDAYVAKPFDIERLLETVAKLIGAGTPP